LVRIFKRVLRGDKTALQRVDQVTIKAFELKAPKYSRRDARALQGQVLSGQICSLFSQEEREAIWDELRSIDYLIPSLFTFFEDLKYLRACADCLKRLVKVSRRDTVRTALERKFPYMEEAGDHYVVEVAESTFVDRSGRAVDRFDLGYRHLWAFAMREYREMPTDAKKKSKDLLAKAGVQRADEEVLSRAANLANRVGFVSDEIQALMQRSSDREIALNALLKARKPDHYQYDQTVLEANVAQIVRLFATATPLPSEYSSPALVCDNPVAAGNRCGFPDEDAQQQDSKYLFIPHLHAESEEEGEQITSFFVRRSIYLAFFGKSADLGIDSGPDLSPSPQHRAQRTGPSASQGLDMDGIERSMRQRLEREELDRAETERRERQEQERREHERHQERLDQERLEQERLEQERLDQERLEQERLEQERLEQERLEQERLEQERLDQERLEQERLEQERLELRRIEETLEREDLQERLAQALQTQQNLEQEKKRHQQHEKQEQERQEEERRRQETREQGRREQEALVQGRTLKDSERARKRHTQIDMESVVAGVTGNQRGLSAAGLQSGRELVVADPSSNTVRNLEERLEQERLEQERRERLEQGRLERERLEQERLERERLEQERLEQERLEQEKLEQERLEQERLEQERLEQERLEQERLERERLEQEKLEQERLEQERLEQERLEQERLEQERLEQERLERLEQERLGRLEQERLGREKLQEGFAQKLQEQEKLDQEKQGQKKREQEQKRREQEQEKRELDKRKGERQRRERREQGRWEQEKTIESERGLAAESTEPRPRRRQVRLYSPSLISASSLLQDPTPLAQTPDSVWITFKVRERGVWRTAQSLHVYSSDPSEVGRIAVKYMRKREQIRVYDTDLNILTPQMCFQAAIANGSNMLLLIPEKEIDINEELEASVSQLLSESDSQMEAGIE
jgi:uncharacterized protein YjbI with pentapeptide repeats